MINLTRHQWKDLARKVAKDWKVLKNITAEVESQAMQKGIDIGVDSTKNALIGVVHDVLKSEYKFGPKRLQQFNDHFRHHLSLVNTSTEQPNENIQQVVLTQNEKDRVKVLIAISQFLESTLSSSTTLSKNSEMKDYINGSYIEVNNAIATIKASVSEDTMKEIIDSLHGTCLYLAPNVIEGEKIEA